MARVPCDGFGQTPIFCSEKSSGHPEKSLNQGAIQGWDKRHAYYFGLLTTVAEHYGIDMEAPWQQLDKKHKDVILRLW